MKRRLLATFLSLCLLVGLLPTVALAEESPASETQGESSEQQATATDSTHVSTTDILSGNSTDGTMSGTCGATEQDNVRWTLNKNGETVTIDGEPKDAYTLTISGTGAMADISYNWTDVDTAPWAQFRSQITRIVIDEGITSIGKYAFIKTSIRDLDLSVCSSLTCISERAFSNIGTDFVSVTFPESLEEIGEAAFSGAGFTEVDLTKCKILHTLGDEAFGYCSNLKSVNILECESLREIGRSCFYSCKKLEDIKLPNSITSIKDAAFTDTGLTKVNWNNLTNLENIAGQVFSKNNNLSVVSLSGCSSLRTIGQYLFLGSSNVITVDLTGCTSLTQVEYPHEFDDVAQNCVVYSEIPLKLPGKTIGAITNGGTFAEGTEFTSGTLATPIKDGAIFAGWYADSNFSGSPVTSTTAGQSYYAKWIDLSTLSVDSIQYGGTAATPTLDGVTFSNWQTEDSNIATVTDGTITAVNVGETTITATATYNGNTAEVSVPVEVIPRVLTYTLAGGDTGSGSITYNYSGGHHALADSLTFQWKDNPDTKVTLREGTDINYTYAVSSENGGDDTARTYDYLPMPVGTYDNVKFNLLNENYTFGLSGGGTRNYLEIDVNVAAGKAQRAYLASAWPKADQNFVYTGQGVLPVEGTLNAYTEDSTSSATVEIGTFTINIEGLNGTSFHEEVSGIESGTNLSAISGLALPTKPGTYIITASAEGNGYYLYKSLVFTINKATVTVKADDQLVYVGDEMPQFTYTVSGLVGTDTLNGTVSFACDATDTDEAGTYPITPSGANVPNTELYNDDIEYETGTLTIRKGSSSGGASHPEAGSTSSSSSSDRYEISKPSNVENGSIKISNSKAEKGDTITITVTPDEGYELDELAVYDEDGDEIDLEDAGDGKYTFEMPEGEVEIEASFVAIVEAPEADFDDVPVDAWYAEAVQYVFANNLMTGVSENSFAPNAQMNRAMVAQILFNMEQPSDTEAPAAFRDVDSDAWYAEAVNWAVWQGYMSGYGTGSFGPNDALTREQLVTVLWRYSGSPVTGDPAMLNTFSDAALTSDYAQQAMIWAYDQGVIGGNADGTLNPRGTATRAEIAQILMNYCENVK